MARRRRRPRPGAKGTQEAGGTTLPRKIKVSVMDYTSEVFEEKIVANVEECFAYMDRDSVTWINVDGVSDPEIIRKLGQHFGMHALVIEDIMGTDQRPKVEDYGSHLYLVLRMLRWDAEESALVDEQVSIIVGKGFLVSFQEEIEGDVLEPVRLRIRSSKGLIRKGGADYLAYAILDAVVDAYFGVLEQVGETIEDIEDRLASEPGPGALRRLHAMKRELIFLRKAVWPLREVVGTLTRGASGLIGAEAATYLRDVHDATIQVADTVETYRDVLSGALDLHLSVISNRMNEVIKFLTIIGTIFLPMTFIAGVYGMNFESVVPEWRNPAGFGASLLIMLSVSVGLLTYFHRRKWI
jgi:magnesium transporter